MQLAEPDLQLGESGRPALDLVEMRLGSFDEGREFLDAGIDVGRAFRLRRTPEHVERPVEALEQRGHVVTQRRQPGEFRIEQRKTIVQSLLFVGKSLHPPGERPVRRLFERPDFLGKLIARRAQLLDTSDDAVARGGERREPRFQRAVILLHAGDCFRRALDVVAAFMALPDEIHHFLQIDIERDGIVPADDLGKRALDIVLPAVEVGKMLLDRPPFLQHRREPILQRLLLGADLFDARGQIADLVATNLNLREALGLAKALLHGAHRIFRIGAGEVPRCRLGLALRLPQRLNSLPHAVEPQLAAPAPPGVAAPASRRARRRPE